MNQTDKTINISELRKIAAQFVKERDWNQFHSPKNLAINLSVEANELLEHFTWITTQDAHEHVNQHRQAIEDEMADVFLTLILLAEVTKTDLTGAFLYKLEKIKERYPVDKFKGKSTKYNQEE